MMLLQMIGDVWYTKHKYMFHQSLIKCDEKVRLFCMKPSREFSSWAVSENTGGNKRHFPLELRRGKYIVMFAFADGSFRYKR